MDEQEKERQRILRRATNRRYRARHPGIAARFSAAHRARHPGYLGPSRQAKVDKIEAIKNASICVDCGGKFPACCMDFDHVGTKIGGVSQMMARGASMEELEAEIAQCEIVCANCHRIRTKNRGSKGWLGLK